MNLFTGPVDALCDALRPGTRFDRYGRMWRLGQTHRDGHFLCGHLGFEKDVDTALWREELQDFEAAEVLKGAVAPFSIRLADFTLVFQTRGQGIEVGSFTSALRTLLRNATTDRWDVALLSSSQSFNAWRSTVDIVTRLRVRLERHGRSLAKTSPLTDLAEDAHATLATIDLRSDDGLTTDGHLVRQLLDQVEDGKGDALAIGRQGDEGNAERLWDSALRGETVLADVAVDPDTGKASIESLLDQLATIDVGEAP